MPKKEFLFFGYLRIWIYTRYGSTVSRNTTFRLLQKTSEKMIALQSIKPTFLSQISG